jgi:hypothetical protein
MAGAETGDGMSDFWAVVVALSLFVLFAVAVIVLVIVRPKS